METEIEVFKTGVITDSEGNTKEWTDDELNTIVNTYNTRIAEDPSQIAPVVKGHPETDDPAYGWVEALKKIGNKIIAKIKLVPVFAEQVKQELYKKVSIALYDDLMLRHIGFLGAVQPAVKGLTPVQFNREEKFNEYYNEFSIALKDDLKRERPEIYKDYLEGDFADPVHFRFPLKKKSDTLASIAIFSRENVHNQYSEQERDYILSRLIRASINHGINFNFSNWKFQEISIPIEELSKNQLINYIKKISNVSKFKEEVTMQEWFDAFIQAMTIKLSENVNEEVATQFQAWVDEYLLASPLPVEEPAPTEETPAETTTETTVETPAGSPAGSPVKTQLAEATIPKEFAERMEKLEKENRLMKFNQYIENQIKEGKLTVGQKSLILNALEYVNANKNQYTFSEGNKTVTFNDGVSMLKSVIESFPKVVEFNEFAISKSQSVNTIDLPSNVSSDPDSITLNKRIEDFIKEQAKLGKMYSYKEALSIISKL